MEPADARWERRPPDPGEPRERSELHLELERLLQPYASEIADEIWGKTDALPDPELVAVHGFESCPACWAGDEDCEACEGAGILRR